LKALRLPTFLREYDKLARQCAAEGVDHFGGRSDHQHKSPTIRLRVFPLVGTTQWILDPQRPELPN
jgi:hypothetical protein